MKRWDAVQIFFVYDTKCLSREEDDPRDAIVYFHPAELAESLRCSLCSQLMGVVQFCRMVFSSPTLINLQRKKFAIRVEGSYVFALCGSTDMPDSVLKRQLAFLHDIFIFYHKSLDEVSEHCKRNKLNFGEAMNFIWNLCLPISQHYGNTHKLTFNVLPTLDLPKSASIIILRASQILESCQEIGGVSAGCILCKNQVLYTQLPSSIVRYLCFISPHQPLVSATQVKTVFTLPECVLLAYVYITKDQLTDIKSHNYLLEESLNCEEKGLICACGKNSENSMRTSSIENCPANCECNVCEKNSTCDELHQLVLYVQGHSDTQLMLLLDEKTCNDPSNINSLWKIGLSSLVDLELDVLNCWENAPKSEAHLNYMYAQYDHTWAAMKGTTVTTSPSTLRDQVFNRSSQLIHETLNEDNSAIENMSLIFSDFAIHSQKLGSLETYCQFNLPGSSEWCNLTSMAKILTDVDEETKTRLGKDHGISLV